MATEVFRTILCFQVSVELDWMEGPTPPQLCRASTLGPTCTSTLVSALKFLDECQWRHDSLKSEQVSKVFACFLPQVRIVTNVKWSETWSVTASNNFYHSGALHKKSLVKALLQFRQKWHCKGTFDSLQCSKTLNKGERDQIWCQIEWKILENFFTRQ